MSRLANTLAATAAAGVLAAGGTLYYLGSETAQETEGSDDVTAVSLELPRVNLPVVSVPAVASPDVVSFDVASPAVRETEVFRADVSSLSVASSEVEKAEVEKAEVVTPEVVITRFVSALKLEELKIPEPPDPAVNTKARLVLLPSPQGVKIVLPDVTDPTERIPLVIELQRTLQALFRDKRNLAYDKTVGIDSTAWKKWIDIYRKNEPYTIEYKALPSGLRIICEVKCPQNAEQIETLDKNLEAYRAAGYNAVLLTFDLTEPLSKLLDVVSLVRSRDMRVVFAYTGPERLEWSVFQDPDKLASFLRSLGAVSDAFLLGWRRTSLHLLLPDPQWINFLVKNARGFNRDLPVIGEAYLGQTAESNESERAVTYNIPENVSAVLCFGIGYKGVAIGRALDLVFPQTKGLPRIGLAIGERPYFDTRNNTKKSVSENNAIKAQIERRFLVAGCIGTMTIRGDGSDGIYDKTLTENLCLPYKEEEKL